MGWGRLPGIEEFAAKPTINASNGTLEIFLHCCSLLPKGLVNVIGTPG